MLLKTAVFNSFHLTSWDITKRVIEILDPVEEITRTLQLFPSSYRTYVYLSEHLRITLVTVAFAI